MKKTLRVLIVEDSLDNAESLLLELRRLGYVVATERVATAEALREALGGRPWDVIFASDSLDGALPAASKTERHRLEEQYRQAQKMEAFGQLAGGVAHDFNNLLTVINGYAELMLASVPPGDPLRDMITDMRQAGERAATLTRQLLAFSRKQVLQPRVLDLNGVVSEMGKLLRRVIGEDVELVTDLQPGLRPVMADPGQIEQVLLNLAVNARDAMPQGGQITVRTRDIDITRIEDSDLGKTGFCESGGRSPRPGPYVMLSVMDTGCGMTPEVRARLFEPFFTTKEPGKGTGLGLATVYGIIEQSGGHIDVRSEPSRGTEFRIYLPQSGRPARQSWADEVRRGVPEGKETILLVEDEDIVRALAANALRQAGYTVLQARDGQEAVFLGEKHQGQIALLLSDVVMPGSLGGGQVAEVLAKLRPGLRIMFMSGYTEDAVVRHGVRKSEAAFLQKPFTPVTLVRKVREVLDLPIIVGS